MMETFGTDFYSEFTFTDASSNLLDHIVPPSDLGTLVELWQSSTVELTELFPYDDSVISAPLDTFLQIDLADTEPQKTQKPAPELLRTTTLTNILSASEEGTSGTSTPLKRSTPSDIDKEPSSNPHKKRKTSVRGTVGTGTPLNRSTPSDSDEEPVNPPPKKRKTYVRPPATSGTTAKRVPIRICGVDGCKKELYHIGDFERHLQTRRHGGGKSSCRRDFGCECNKPLEASRLDAVIRHVKNVREASEKMRLVLSEKENSSLSSSSP